MRKYLYFTHRDDVPLIIESGKIDNRKSKNRSSGGGDVIDSVSGKVVIAYVYNVEKIQNSLCYVASPIDNGQIPTLRLCFLKVFGIPLIPTLVFGLRIPRQLVAITFDIENELDLIDWYLVDTNLSEKMYCESVSTKALRIANIEFLEHKKALSVIGLAYPFRNFRFGYFKKTGILISKNFIIGN